VRMTPTQALPTDSQSPVEAKPFEAWKQKGEELFITLQLKEDEYETSQWVIGDWLLKGKETLKFGKKAYDVAEQITGWKRGNLYNVVSVVRRFQDPSLRSETKLKWSHFKELARIKDEKKRLEVLDKLNDGFPKTVLQVRDAVEKVLEKKQAKQGQSAPKAFYLHTSLEKEDRHLFRVLAKRRKKTSDELLRSIVLKFIAEHKHEIQVKSRARKR
jgi:hypothetical protein